MTFDDSARARIARGWLNSSLDQATYAAQHGISTRTLRDWVCRFGGGRRPQAHVRAAIVSAIEQLQNVLAALDAEAAAGSAGTTEKLHDVAERHAASEARVTPPGAARVSPETLTLTSSAWDAERAAGAHAAKTVRDTEAAGDVPEVAGPEVAAPDIAALVDGAGPVAAHPCPAARAVVGQHGRGPSVGNAPAGVLDIEALRKRAAERWAARATSGAPKKNPFLDWDSE